MGQCWNCETKITLGEEETRCDNCGEIVRYRCNNCKQPFDIENKKIKKKVRECNWCGFFKCPHCNSCSPHCLKYEHINKIKKILNNLIPINKWSEAEEQLQKIVDYFEDIKLGKEQRNCPFGVPISYAKNRIKSALARMEGYKTNNFIDQTKFKERLKKILDVSLGTELTINKTREAGSYGQEYRDVFNYAVCAGELKPIKKKKDEIEYISYKRIEKEPCPYLHIKNLLINQCLKCKTNFPREAMYCNKCKYTKNTKYHNQDEPYELRLKLSNKDICQLNRGKFKRDDGKNKII